MSIHCNMNDIEVKINTLTRAQQRQLILHCQVSRNQYSRMRWAQETIGRASGDYCRETANRTARVLHEMGLVVKQYHHRTTCQYEVHEIFQEYAIKRVGDRLTLVRFLSKALLFHLGNALQINKVTPFLNRFNRKISGYVPIGVDVMERHSSMYHDYHTDYEYESLSRPWASLEGGNRCGGVASCSLCCALA